MCADMACDRTSCDENNNIYIELEMHVTEGSLSCLHGEGGKHCATMHLAANGIRHSIQQQQQQQQRNTKYRHNTIT